MTQNTDNNVSSMYQALRRLLVLYIENAKLTVAEKITHLVGAMAVCFIALLFGLVAFIFAVIGLATWLQAYIDPFWSYFIVAGAFILIILVLVIFRKWLIFNPIAKFMSRLIIENPN